MSDRQTHWLDRVIDIFSSDENDLVELAAIAGCDARRFYVGADMTGVDISGQDLSRLDFTGADLSKVIYDSATKVNPTYVPLDWNLNIFKSAELSPLVYDYIGEMVHSGECHHRTKALRVLVRLARIDVPTFGRLNTWMRHLYDRKEYISAFNSRRGSRRNMTLKIYSEEHGFVLRCGRMFMGRSAGYNATAMIGMELRAGRRPPNMPGEDDLRI
jgi:hypothetical protein